MTEPTASWDVAATVMEPPALVAAFAAWHLDQGARRVVLFFDDPADPAADMLAQTPGVEVVRCDAAHWDALGSARPARHQSRQTMNATAAYRRSQADWLLHCDADEFAFVPAGVGRTLGVQARDVDVLRLDVWERYTLANATPAHVLTGPFRRPFRGTPEEGRVQFGPDYPMTMAGLTGHTAGKSFTRTGTDARIRIHMPRAGNMPLGRIGRPAAAAVLHFEGLTPLGWVLKLLRKARDVYDLGGLPMTDHRKRQVEAVLAEGGDARAARDLHDRLKVAGPRLARVLRAEGLSRAAGFDPIPALEARFPGLSAELTPDAIDRWLRARYGDLPGRFGL